MLVYYIEEENEFEIFDNDHLLENDLLKYKSCLRKRKNMPNTVVDSFDDLTEDVKVNKYKIDENDEDFEVKKSMICNLINSNIGMGNKDFMNEFMQKRNGFVHNDSSEDEIVYE